MSMAMNLRQCLTLLASAILLCSASAPARAFHSLDPRIGQPLTALLGMAGQQCQMGNPQGCAMASQLQQSGNYLEGAQFACQNGDPHACQALQQGAQQIGSMHQQVMAVQNGGSFDGIESGYAPPAPTQDTHQQRMQAIQDFGTQNTQQFQQRMIQQDATHQNFLNSIRQ